MKEQKFTIEYNPAKLFPLDLKARPERYLSKEPSFRLNTKNGNISFNKKAVEILKISKDERAKFKILCDGFKLYIDSMVDDKDKNFTYITKSNIACSSVLRSELQKLYKIEEGFSGLFNFVEVEKHRYRIELKEKTPTKKKEKQK